jgi:alpha-L-rhamnosidase
LVENIKQYTNHLTTGFLGTPYLCHVLSRFGYADVAYKLLLQETYPSWLYPVKMGATTIWERWDGIKPDGSFQAISMNSFNHYAYGAIGDWMYKTVAGINYDAANPGYKQILIAPKLGGNFTTASASLETLYGTVSSAWKIENDKFIFDVTIPANATATIQLPSSAKAKIKENSADIQQKIDAASAAEPTKDVTIAVGSGVYHFEYPLAKSMQ